MVGFLFARKTRWIKGVYKNEVFYLSFLSGWKRQKNLSVSLFFSATESHVIQRTSFYNSLNNTK